MMHRHLLFTFVVLVIGFWSIGDGHAAASRIALVVGNSDYATAPLANPANDARLVAQTLRGLGFDVIERIDANQKEMKLAIFELGDRLEAADRDAVGLFFYAGHGIQINGNNYLVPVGAIIEKERDVSIEAVSAQWVLSTMEFAGNAMNFVILDACRNNPLTRGFRSASRGLARMDAPRGSLVAYSTSPGEVAADGNTINSPYTIALVAAMNEPGVPVERMFRLVRNAVMEETNDRQVPWEASSLTGGDFYFNPLVTVAAATPTATLTPEPAPAAPEPVATTSAGDAETERLFWATIKDSTEPAMFQEYLRQFPNGTFAGLARLKLGANGQGGVNEHDFWVIVKDDDDPAMYEEYLRRFPDGIFAGLAKLKLGATRGVQQEVDVVTVVPEAVPDVPEAASEDLEVAPVASIDPFALQYDEALNQVIIKYCENNCIYEITEIFKMDVNIYNVDTAKLTIYFYWSAGRGGWKKGRAETTVRKTAASYEIVDYKYVRPRTKDEVLEMRDGGSGY